MSEHFRKLERMYLSAPIVNQVYEGTTIEITEERAKISTELQEKHFHAAGAAHGSVYFRMLDDAAFFAVNSIVEDVFVYTVSFNIHLTRPVSSGTITSVGRVKFKSSRLYIAESTLYDGHGEVIGFGTGDFMKSRMALSEELGYK